MAEVLELNRDLYPLEAVQAAVDAYAGLARIEVRATPDMITVEVHEPNEDVEHLTDELANHALFEAVRRYRAGP